MRKLNAGLKGELLKSGVIISECLIKVRQIYMY